MNHGSLRIHGNEKIIVKCIHRIQSSIFLLPTNLRIILEQVESTEECLLIMTNGDRIA